jgi:ubiquinone/menaquinone biosynthesis C-methylase UbiE
MPTIVPFPRRTGSASRDGADPVRVAYDTLAPAYDAFTAGYRHDRWLHEIERVAQRHGLPGRTLLDVACGTGKSFLPLLERGYSVTGCDLSPEMARRAASKAPTARVIVADMRELPRLGAFDLITCLDDAINYLLHPDEVRSTLAGIARHLSPGGLAIWDINTLSMVRSSFSSDWVADRGEWFLCWHGTASADVGRGGIVEARVDAFRRRDMTWTRSTSLHRQRHWPLAEITRLAAESGLRILEVLGQSRGAQLEPEADEENHIKAMFVARRAERGPA